MSLKTQMFVVHVEHIYDDEVPDESPITDLSEQHDWVKECVHSGDFMIVESYIKDYEELR